jgi:hypothetical protein
VIDVALLKIVGFSALAVVVVGWLAVSFLAPAARSRDLVARLATLALYVALACLFTNLAQNAWARGQTALLIPFGFLWVVFLAGVVVSLWKWVGALRGGAAGGAPATH